MSTAAAETRCLLLSQLGPTSFMVGEQGDARRRRNKVTIGPQRCSCRATAVPCRHVRFVMTRVLRVPPESELASSPRLSEREIEWVLACRERASAARAQAEATATRRALTQRARFAADEPPAPTNGHDGASPPANVLDANPNGTVRRVLAAGDECAVCLDEISADVDGSRPLTWCRSQCGKNFHFECLERAVQYNPVCPLCRSAWGAVVADPPPQRAAGNAIIRGRGKSAAASRPPSKRWNARPRGHAVVCTDCERQVGVGNRYRCVSCGGSGGGGDGNAAKRVDLCSTCMRRRRREGRRGDAVACAGGRHYFVYKAAPAAMWLPAESETAAAALRRRATLMDQIQQREITPADYEALRMLDGNGATPLHAFLARSLPPSTRDPLPPCAACGVAMQGYGGGEGVALKQLPCGHAMHHACALDAFAAVGSGGSAQQRARAVTCPCEDCGVAIFPGLVPKAPRSRVEASGEGRAEGGPVDGGDGIALTVGGRGVRPLGSEGVRGQRRGLPVRVHRRAAPHVAEMEGLLLVGLNSNQSSGAGASTVGVGVAAAARTGVTARTRGAQRPTRRAQPRASAPSASLLLQGGGIDGLNRGAAPPPVRAAHADSSTPAMRAGGRRRNALDAAAATAASASASASAPAATALAAIRAEALGSAFGVVPLAAAHAASSPSSAIVTAAAEASAAAHRHKRAARRRGSRGARAGAAAHLTRPQAEGLCVGNATSTQGPETERRATTRSHPRRQRQRATRPQLRSAASHEAGQVSALLGVAQLAGLALHGMPQRAARALALPSHESENKASGAAAFITQVPLRVSPLPPKAPIMAERRSIMSRVSNRAWVSNRARVKIGSPSRVNVVPPMPITMPISPLLPTPSPPRSPSAFIGAAVRKMFGELGEFDGVVNGYARERSSNALLYTVQYEDGDVEDLDEDELREIIIRV